MASARCALHRVSRWSAPPRRKISSAASTTTGAKSMAVCATSAGFLLPVFLRFNSGKARWNSERAACTARSPSFHLEPNNGAASWRLAIYMPRATALPITATMPSAAAPIVALIFPFGRCFMPELCDADDARFWCRTSDGAGLPTDGSRLRSEKDRRRATPSDATVLDQAQNAHRARCTTQAAPLGRHLSYDAKLLMRRSNGRSA